MMDKQTLYGTHSNVFFTCSADLDLVEHLSIVDILNFVPNDPELLKVTFYSQRLLGHWVGNHIDLRALSSFCKQNQL